MTGNVPTGNGPADACSADACSAENVPARDDLAAGSRFNLLDFIGGLCTESRDELGERFTHLRQAKYILGRLAGSADVAELVATQLGDIDPSYVTASSDRCSNPERARRRLAGLIVVSSPVERYVRAAEDHDLFDEEDQQAEQAMLALHRLPWGIEPDAWHGLLCYLIITATPDQRLRHAAACPAWVAFADAVEDPALLARVLAAIETA